MEALIQFVSSDTSDSAALKQQRWLRVAVVCFGAILFFVTGPLWYRTTEFPQVPLIGLARNLPPWLDQVLLVMLAFSASLLIVTDARSNQHGGVLFLVSSLGLVLTNQHRLQPWLCQLLILVAFGLLFRAKRYVSFARLLLISIYLFSAASKLDYQFVHTLGQQFASTLLNYVGIAFDAWPEHTRLLTAMLFPAGELVVGCSLLFPRTRTAAASLGIAIHLVLLLVLGPWGLQHGWGVLCWNVFFIVQLGILFLWRGRPTTSAAATESEATTKSATKTPTPTLSPPKSTAWRTYAALAILALPLLEPFGLWDHWPAWQLYAPRNSRVSMQVLEHAVSRLPAELLPYVHEAGPNEVAPWRRIDLDQWSLDSVRVPIYPQDRFQLGAALAIATNAELGGAVLVELQDASNRWSGERTAQMLRSTQEITEAASSFRFNAIPKQNSRSDGTGSP